jgi:hypothetical protein
VDHVTEVALMAPNQAVLASHQAFGREEGHLGVVGDGS